MRRPRRKAPGPPWRARPLRLPPRKTRPTSIRARSTASSAERKGRHPAACAFPRFSPIPSPSRWDGRGRMKLAAFLAFLFFAAPALAGAPALPRVASLSVCADQYLLALADPSQIAGLSVDATDPALSFYAAKAGAFPRLRQQA